MNRLLKIVPGAAALALAAGAVPANASTIINPGFETGDTTGWFSNGVAGAAATSAGLGISAPVLLAQSGLYFGYAISGLQDEYITLTQSFTLAAGEILSGWVAFLGGDPDGGTFNDDGYLSISFGRTIVDLFTSSIAETGTNGSTGWRAFSFTAPRAGTYTLEAGVENVGDDGFNSLIALDAGPANAIPEPKAWAMMILGFATIGFAMRRRSTRVSFA